MKIFIVAFIYRYASISATGDFGDKNIDGNSEIFGERFYLFCQRRIFCVITMLKSAWQFPYESYTEGRPGVTWHLSNRLSCLYLWALHLRVWSLVFGLERLGAFALSLSDIDNSARDQRTEIIS